MARILTFPGTAFCEKCGGHIRFDVRARMEDFVHGECENDRCEMNDKRLKFNGQWIEVALDPTEDAS